MTTATRWVIYIGRSYKRTTGTQSNRDTDISDEAQEAHARAMVPDGRPSRSSATAAAIDQGGRTGVTATAI